MVQETIVNTKIQQHIKIHLKTINVYTKIDIVPFEVSSNRSEYYQHPYYYNMFTGFH